MSHAFCCATCAGTEPHWRIERSGDAVVSWACDAHLAAVCDGMQRDFEISQLVVTDSRKRREWAGIASALDNAMRDAAMGG
jgi:hypothetical protein